MIQNIDLNILIELRTKRVMNVQLSTTPGICEDGYRILIGEPAYYLYIALTGHDWSEHPGMATPTYANTARAHIQANAWRNPAWGLVREVVNQWGLHIRPWLGCYLYQNGKLVEDAPEYRLLFGLLTGRCINPAAHYTIVPRPFQNRGGGRG